MKCWPRACAPVASCPATTARWSSAPSARIPATHTTARKTFPKSSAATPRAAWRWARLDETPELIIPFKQDVYRQVVRYFAPFAAARDAEQTLDIVRKTARKMSAEGRARVLEEFPLPEPLAGAFRGA